MHLLLTMRASAFEMRGREYHPTPSRSYQIQGRFLSAVATVSKEAAAAAEALYTPAGGEPVGVAGKASANDDAILA